MSVGGGIEGIRYDSSPLFSSCVVLQLRCLRLRKFLHKVCSFVH